MLDIKNEMSKSIIKFIKIQNNVFFFHVCSVLFIVCLYVCVCECLLPNNNHKIKVSNSQAVRSTLLLHTTFVRS